MLCHARRAGQLLLVFLLLLRHQRGHLLVGFLGWSQFALSNLFYRAERTSGKRLRDVLSGLYPFLLVLKGSTRVRAHNYEAQQAVLERSIRLEPRYFDENISETLRDRLFHEVEGQCFGDEGYVLSICDILVVSLGFINDDDGSATYRIKYRALVFKPFHDEVLDAVVSNVTDTGITCSVGPFSFMIGGEVCSAQQAQAAAI